MVEIILWILFYLVGCIVVIALMKREGTSIEYRLSYERTGTLVQILLSWLAVVAYSIDSVITLFVDLLCLVIIKIGQLLGSYK